MLVRLLVAVLAVGMAVAGCTSDDAPEPEPPRPSPEAVTLRLMTFNIEYGGTVVSFDQVVAAVQAAEADVVVVNEPEGNVVRLARALGWEHWSRRLAVVSQLPLLDPPGGADFVYVETAPGQVAAVTNVHLPSNPYGPNRVRDGMGRAGVLDLERRLRMPDLRTVLATMGPLAQQGVPTFVAGDFNAPSGRDWVRRTVGDRPQLRYPVDWPTSRAMEQAGFTDSYRAVHPDPVRDPGLTWPAERPEVDGYNPPPRAPADRIDFIWAGGSVTVRDSEIVGEQGAADVAVEVDPWPSDHRGVVSTFDVPAATPPALVSVGDPLVTVGSPLTLRVHRPDQPGEQLAVTCGGDTMTPALPDGADGVVTVETDGSGPGFAVGACRAELLAADGDRIATTTFWLREPDQEPVLRSVRAVYEVGEPVRVGWEWAPGNRHDWVAVTPRGQGPSGYLTYIYTDATVAGRGAIGGDAVGAGTWPLPPGRYSLYLCVDDGYQQVATADFTVRRR